MCASLKNWTKVVLLMIYTKAGSVNTPTKFELLTNLKAPSRLGGQKPLNKKIVVSVLATFILASFHLTEAQQPKKVPRIGILLPNPPTVSPQLLKAFQQGLRELGYVEG